MIGLKSDVFSAFRAPTKEKKRGAFFSLEALCAIILLFVSASALPLFSFQRQTADTFYLCSDAAILLSKTNPSSDMQSMAKEIGQASGLCISIHSDGKETSYCADTGRQDTRYSFQTVMWEKGKISNVFISCRSKG